MIFALRTLRKRAPSSASAADDATDFKIVQSDRIGPLSLMSWLSTGIEPRK